MSSILDYIAWRGDLSLEAAPFNEIDALIFCEFAYLKLKGIVPEEVSREGIPLETAATLFFDSPDVEARSDMGILFGTEVVNLFKLMATTVRYKNLRLCGFVEHSDDFQQRTHKAEGALDRFSFVIDDSGRHTVKHLKQQIAAVNDQQFIHRNFLIFIIFYNFSRIFITSTTSNIKKEAIGIL